MNIWVFSAWGSCLGVHKIPTTHTWGPSIYPIIVSLVLFYRLMNTIGRSMDNLFWRLPVMAYLWVVLCCISPDICLRWEWRAWRRQQLTKAKRGSAPSLFGLITRLSRFIILPTPARILSSNAEDFDKVIWQLNPLFHQLSLSFISTQTQQTLSGN